MEIALNLAKEAFDAGEVPVGAVVVRDNEILGKGRNRMIEDNDPTAHAEIVAIRDAARNTGEWRLDGATLYVTLEPCAMCAGAIINARMKRVVFGAMDRKKGAVVSIYSLLSDARLGIVEVTKGLLAEESSRLLKKFFVERRAL